MHKIGTLLISFVFCVLAGNSFAQKVPLSSKIVRKAKVGQLNPRSLAPEISGVYIPPGTTMAALERRVRGLILLNPALTKRSVTATKIAVSPKRLRAFQTEMGKPLFEESTPPKQVEFRALSTTDVQLLFQNQARFMRARANGEYDARFRSAVHGSTPEVSSAGNGDFASANPIATAVCQFYTDLGFSLDQFPRVGKIDTPDGTGYVYEFPVDELTWTRPDGQETTLSALEFVVFRPDNGPARFVRRGLIQLRSTF